MCKEIFISERMYYLQHKNGYTITKAFIQASKEWNNYKGNSSNHYEETCIIEEE